MGSKRHFFDCVRMHDLVFDRKSPFSIHRSDCIRIGLKLGSDDSPLNGTYMSYALRGPAGNAMKKGGDVKTRGGGEVLCMCDKHVFLCTQATNRNGPSGRVLTPFKPLGTLRME